VGGKALALAALSRAGLRIPDFFCVTTDAYRAFQDATGLRGRILHESYVNIRGTEAVVEHVRMVWALLWSDAALFYRQELGLDAARSVMAVVVQGLVAGRASGVCFSQSPTELSQALVESVYGLNHGLVDGNVEPNHRLPPTRPHRVSVEGWIREGPRLRNAKS